MPQNLNRCDNCVSRCQQAHRRQACKPSGSERMGSPTRATRQLCTIRDPSEDPAAIPARAMRVGAETKANHEHCGGSREQRVGGHGSCPDSRRT